MQKSYGIVWRDGDHPVTAGKLELLPTGLRLDGRSGTREIPYRDLDGVRIGRSAVDRLDGRPSLVLDRRRGDRVTIATVAQSSVIGELVERISALRHDADGVMRLVVVLPLKPHAHEPLAMLLRSGPPFDPAEIPGLERHEVMLTPREAVFVFDSDAGLEALTPVLMDPAVWEAAPAWREYIDGPPRFAEAVYTWEREEAPDDNVYYLPTPGPGDSEGGEIY